jgi:hypothetical protein
MKTSLLLVLTFSCVVFSTYSGIWPEQLSFSPPSSEGWSSTANELAALTGNVLFYTNPVIIPTLNSSLSFYQTGYWGIALISDGYIPSYDISGENVTVCRSFFFKKIIYF